MNFQIKKSNNINSKDLLENQNNEHPLSAGTIYFCDDNFILYDYLDNNNNVQRDFINSKSSQMIVDENNNRISIGLDNKSIFLKDGIFQESSQDLYSLIRGDENVEINVPQWLLEADRLSSLYGNAGNNKKPIYFENGIPKICDDTLNISISGSADSAIKDDLGRTISSSYILKSGDLINGQITIKKDIEQLLILNNNINTLSFGSNSINSSSSLLINNISGKQIILGNNTSNNGLYVYGKIKTNQDPVEDMDVATKKYVDSQKISLEKIFYLCEQNNLNIINIPITSQINKNNILIFYNGLLMEEGINFIYNDTNTSIILLDFVASINDQFIFIYFK